MFDHGQSEVFPEGCENSQTHVAFARVILSVATLLYIDHGCSNSTGVHVTHVDLFKGRLCMQFCNSCLMLFSLSCFDLSAMMQRRPEMYDSDFTLRIISV